MKFIISFLVILFGFFFIQRWYYRDFSPPKKISAMHKVWKHRLSDAIDLNEEIVKVSKSGFSGVELDIYFQQDKMFISHDLPTEQTQPSDLSTLIKSAKEQQLNLWLDFKTLSPMAAILFAKKLKDILEINNYADKVFVETKNFFVAIILRTLGVNTTLWYQPRTGFKQKIYHTLYQLLISTFSIQNLSADFNNFDSVVKAGPSNDHLIFTVNDTELLQKFCAVNSVKIILTDLDYQEVPNECK